MIEVSAAANDNEKKIPPRKIMQVIMDQCGINVDEDRAPTMEELETIIKPKIAEEIESLDLDILQENQIKDLLIFRFKVRLYTGWRMIEQLSFEELIDRLKTYIKNKKGTQEGVGTVLDA